MSSACPLAANPGTAIPPASSERSPENEWQLTPMPPRPQAPLLRLYDNANSQTKLIGTTCFFRNRPLLRTLLEQVDPAAATIDVLVHAASVGADVYSFCIAWELFFQGRKAPRLRCRATDLSSAFLVQAKRGVYPVEILEGMSAAERAFFETVDAQSCQVSARIRSLVEFLPPASYVTFDSEERFDIVILLNSLLYVSGPDQTRTLNQIASYNTGHLLVTGYHADQIRADLQRHGYLPVSDRFEEIYESWTCRRSLPADLMIDGITFHTPAMPPLQPCADYHFRFGSLFRKRPGPSHSTQTTSASKPETRSSLPVALFNDTGRVPHVGCRGVSLGHELMLARLGVEVRQRSWLGDWTELWQGDVPTSLRAFHESALPGLLQEVGAVIVNGEGTIHHGHGLHLLTILAGAQELGLPTFLVNAVFQECPLFHDTLRRLDEFTVRDARSAAYLEALDIPHRIVFDSILEAEFDPQPATDLSGKIVITDWHDTRRGDVGAALEALHAELGPEAVFYPLESAARESDWRHAVADLAAARLVVTGRHHGVCLAGLAGVPFVALGSNTWKIEGLLELLPGQPRLCNDLRQLRAHCQEAVRDPGKFVAIQNFLHAQRPLATFQKLSEESFRARARAPRPPALATIDPAETEFVTQLADFFASRNLLQLHWLSDATVRLAPLHLDSIRVAPRLAHTDPRQPRLPFKDGAFDSIVNLASLACVSDVSLPGWLAELHRITRRDAWIALEATTSRNLSWWQGQFAAAGFKPHPKLSDLPPEPTAPHGLGPITLLLEKAAATPHALAPSARPAGTKTICLATNYLLMNPPTRQMWADLGAHLETQGCQLVLLSTTEPEPPLPFPVHRHPYLMRDFAQTLPKIAARAGLHASPRELEWLNADRSRVPGGYPMIEALQGLAAFRAYSRELLETLQPSFLLLADNTLCQTALLQQTCWELGLPVQIYERGLLPETLMLESRGIQAWSDFRTHWLTQDLPETAFDVSAYARIRDYYLARKPQKYHQAEFAGGGATLRRDLGLENKKLVVFLGGGYEANGHAPTGGRYERHFYPAFPTTNAALLALCSAVESRPDIALVFKPHPLDPETYAVAAIEGAQVVRDVNVHALIEAADVVAAQYTTLQFEAALYEKPVLALARSAWYGRDATYEVHSAEMLKGQLNAALERQDWKRIQRNAHAFITWLMQDGLAGCTTEVPARRQLPDLAAFISRTALDSRNLEPAAERWQRAHANLEQLRRASQT